MVPSGARHASFGDIAIRWNYTTVLNIVFLLVAAVLVWRFLTTGGRAMLSMMGGGSDDITRPHGHHTEARADADSG